MSGELKAEALPEGRHLRHRRHRAPGAAQHHHVRVIDHHPFGRPGKIAQRAGEKHLAVETPERGVALEEQHLRITKRGFATNNKTPM